MVILSPALAPLTLNCRNGFFATDGPHCAVITVLPLCAAVTSWMNHAGIVLPAESLRWPVSISWLISTRTVALSPAAWARMRIGSAMSFSLVDRRSAQPPQPPSVTLISFCAYSTLPSPIMATA